MSGKSYKKLRKEEKNKKKLKTALKNVVSKTQLPKGQNLTDTNFKVKKIVIRDQVKPHKASEVLYHNKLNVTELTARLNHHNVSVKHEALEGLKDLITNHPIEVLDSHYVQVLESVVKLVLDETSSIRKAANKIVSVILGAVPRHKLVTIFASLNSYLLCGLTHIDRNIRDDALVLLDSCLKDVPELCEKYALQLLAVCLDLISERNVASRTLSLNLESTQVVTKWRTNVLERILNLLSCLLNSHKDPGVLSEKIPSGQVAFTPGEVNYFPVYTPYLTSQNQSMEVCENATKLNTGSKTTATTFADSIIPLLLSMFLEANPIERATMGNGVSTVINEETCKLLTLVVNIIQSLIDLFKNTTKSEIPSQFLSKKYTKSLIQTLVQSRFPYSVNVPSKISKKLLKNASEQNVSESSAVNLLVTRLVLDFTPTNHWSCVLSFLENCFKIAERFSSSDCTVFAACVTKVCREPKIPENSSFLSKVVQICLEGNSQLVPHFFRLLGNVALDPQMNFFHENPDFEKWLGSLPMRATRKKIQPYQLDLISKIAVRNYSCFSNSLGDNIELILHNIPNVIVADEARTEDLQWKMATLLYWVPDWDEELMESLEPGIKACYWGEHLTKYISEIAALKSSN